MDTVYRLFSYLPLAVSLTILFASMFYPSSLDYIPILVVAVAFLWASQIIIFSKALGWRFVACTLLLLIIHTSTWCYMVLIYRDAALEIPFPAQTISRISGIARFDSSKSEKGNTVVELSLQQAFDRYGDTGKASGSLLVICPDDLTLLFGQRVDVVGELVSKEDTWFFFTRNITVIQSDGKILEFYHYLRRRILTFVIGRLELLPPDVSLLSTALLVGRSDAWSPLRKKTTESGCAHVLALSGMHLQAIIGILSLLLARIIRKRKICLFTIPLALSYVAIVGNKPSLARALIMVLVSNLDKRTEAKYALANVMAIHTWLAPQTIGTPGAVLSYSALTGIFFFSPIIAKTFANVMPRHWAVLFATAVGASLCTAPLALGLFGSWYGIGMLLSLVLAPIALFLLLLTFLWLIFPLGPISSLARFSVEIFTWIVTWGSNWSLRHEQFGTPFAWLMTMISLLTVLGLLKYANRTARIRSYRKHDVGFSLRFPPSNNPTA